MIRLQFAIKQTPRPDRFRKRVERKLKPIRASRTDEARYKRDLYSVVNHITSKVEQTLIPYLKAESGIIELRGKDAMPEDEIRRRLAEIRRNNQVNPDSAERVAGATANRVKDTVDERLRNEIRRSVGIDIKPAMLDDAHVTPSLNSAVKDNVKLITSIPNEYLDRVEKHLVEAVVAGKRHEELARLVHNIGQSTYRRAEIIARDQVSKMNSSFNRIRQQSVGIEKYVWSTSNDERVRPEHVENNGKTFRWAEPPEETGHPGEDIMCRCVALPVFDLDEMEARVEGL